MNEVGRKRLVEAPLHALERIPRQEHREDRACLARRRQVVRAKHPKELRESHGVQAQYAPALDRRLEEMVDGAGPFGLLAPFGLARGNEGAAAGSALCERRLAQRCVNPLGGGSRDAQLPGQLADGRQPIAGIETAGNELRFRLLVDLRRERQTTLPVQKKAHRSPATGLEARAAALTSWFPSMRMMISA